MKVFRLLVTILFLGALSACATPGTSTYNYTAPVSNGKVKNSIIVNENFETVWDRLVGKLASGFFVINNIDKASRLINVSFSSDSPEQYIDCGETYRTYKYNDDTQTYRYKVAEDSTYKMAGSWGQMNNLPVTADIYRDASLDGRINIYVAPHNGQGTQVSVNVKYIFEASVSGTLYGYSAAGVLVNQKPIESSASTMDFTTNETKTKNWGSGGKTNNITCSSTGDLEHTLLELAMK